MLVRQLNFRLYSVTFFLNYCIIVMATVNDNIFLVCYLLGGRLLLHRD